MKILAKIVTMSVPEETMGTEPSENSENEETTLSNADLLESKCMWSLLKQSILTWSERNGKTMLHIWSRKLW